jgi:mono/diheme cytochrome c family protein
MRQIVRMPLAALAIAAMIPMAQAEDLARQVQFGSILYDLSCSVCHGPRGMGDGTMSGQMKVPPADLTQLSAKAGGTFPLAYVTEVIKGGGTAHGGQMPAWGLIFLKDFEAFTFDTPAGDRAMVERRVGYLAAYIESLQKL